MVSSIPLDRKIHATEEGHAARRVRPNFLAQLLGLLAEQRSQQQRPQDYLKEIASLLSRVRGRMR
jgi:adenylosuccinate lyase